MSNILKGYSHVLRTNLLEGQLVKSRSHKELAWHTLKKLQASTPAVLQFEQPIPFPGSPLHLIFRFRHRAHCSEAISICTLDPMDLKTDRNSNPSTG
jgi:hypothetical protein